MSTQVDILLKARADLAGVKQMQSGIAGLKSALVTGASFAGFNLTLQGAVSLLRTTFRETIAWADSLDEVAERLQTTTTAVQALDYAARHNNATLQDLVGVEERLRLKMAEAIGGSKDAQALFAKLGLNVEELVRMAPERRIEAFGRALANKRGDVDTFATAVEILGRTSAKLLQTLEDIGTRGADGITKAAAAAGQLADPGTLKALADFDQAMEDASISLKVMVADVIGATRNWWNAGAGIPFLSALAAQREIRRNTTLPNEQVFSQDVDGGPEDEGESPPVVMLEEYRVLRRELNEFQKELGDFWSMVGEEARGAFIAARTVEDAFDGITDGIADAITGAKDFGEAMRDVARDVIAQLVRMTVKAMVFRAIMSFFPGFGEFLGIPEEFGGGRALGGPVRPNVAYMVGERGPELFIPSMAGSIVPSAGDSAAAGAVHVHVNAGVAATVRAEVLALLPEIARAAAGMGADMRQRRQLVA